ncbi:hypothetical protein GCM10009624_16180 [Gordonia sinesedis]
MIPSRSRVTQWRFDALSDEADSIRMRGDTIETAGTRISARCSEMPALRAWQGLGHSAAQEAVAGSWIFGWLGSKVGEVVCQ